LKRNLLKILTGGRLTSWLFTKRRGIESGTTKHKSIYWQGGGFDLETSRSKIEHLKPLGHSASVWKHFKLFYTYQDTRVRLNIIKVATMLTSRNELQITRNAMLRLNNVSVKQI